MMASEIPTWVLPGALVGSWFVFLVVLFGLPYGGA